MEHIIPKYAHTIAHMPPPITGEKCLGLLTVIGGGVRMLSEMRRADPVMRDRLPLPKETQALINSNKLADSSLQVGHRPLKNFDSDKHTHRDLLKGHPFAEIKVSCLKE